jgi:acetyl esterase/lipase
MPAAYIAVAGHDPLRDDAGPPIAFQLLWYPSTMWDPSLPSFTENASALVLDRAAVAAFSRWYTAHVDLSDPPPGLAPGRAENLAGLPAAYLAVAGHDLLRDDGIRYGELLAAAGVPVEVHNAETMCTATSATPVWCRPRRPGWIAGWPHCAPDCIRRLLR